MRVTAAWLLVALAFPLLAHAQEGALPMAVGELELASLAGEWHEIAAYGSWWQRRCVADTRYVWIVRGPRTIDVQCSCTGTSGVESRSGRIRTAEPSRPGQLSARFAPVVLSWLPGVWSDYWVFGRSEDPGWLLVGDRRRQRLALLSRWAVLDEAAFAAAIAAARRQGFEVDRLLSVPQIRGSARLLRPSSGLTAEGASGSGSGTVPGVSNREH